MPDSLVRNPIFLRYQNQGKMTKVPTTLPPNLFHYEVRNLLPDTTYGFWVTATNDIGEGLPSKELTFSTQHFNQGQGNFGYLYARITNNHIIMNINFQPNI